MNTPSIPSGFLPVHSVSCCKIILALSITISSLLLLSGCAKQNATSEGEILTEPVTQSEEITTQASDALAFADENTDYPYIDITDDILIFIDSANQAAYGISDISGLDDATLETIGQTFYDTMPDVSIEKTDFASFKEVTLDQECEISMVIPAREYYECPQGITIPTQDAVNQAVAIIKGAFASDCTIENAYIYYYQNLSGELAITRDWVVLLTATLSDGSPCEFTVRIDAFTGALQRANHMGAYQSTSESVTDKTYDPITKDNYETYAAATLDYLLAAGIAVDESVAPIVTRYMTISYYAIVYTTTTGEHYQAFLYTDGCCATIARILGEWDPNSDRISTVEDMQNYTMDWE